jgi:UDP-N-acetylmuramoyl-tripeptide--D-alanyl-D-alanine ligase
MAPIQNLYNLYLQSAGLTTDSRQAGENMIFFALRGEKFNGNRFASPALENGAKLAVIDDPQYDTGKDCLLVDNTLQTLQELAAWHRKQLNIPVIGLTGSNGKTTTKELISKVLARKYNVHATSGNLNNHIGVPLTLLGIKPEHELAVIEMGANHEGEIARLCEMAEPTHGLITNIGKAHLEGFGSIGGVIRAKTELYRHLIKKDGSIWVNHDDSLLMRLLQEQPKTTYGSNPEANVQGKLINAIPFVKVLWNKLQIDTRLFGDYQFSNIMAAICAGISFGVGPDDISGAISEYIPGNNRSQLITRGSNTLMMDAYNANPASMLATLRNFRHFGREPRLIILGDMLELGIDSPAEHRAVLAEASRHFEQIILVGPQFRAVCTDNSIPVFDDTEAAAAWLRQHPFHNCHILLKASRGMELEKLIEHL